MKSRDTDAAIVHRTFDTEQDDPATALAEAVAEIEDVDTTQLPTTYDCIDHVLDRLFSDPPSPEAQVEIEFSYQSYRIRVDQDGNARFVEVG